MHTSAARMPAEVDRLQVEVNHGPATTRTLAEDVRDGLTRQDKCLPPKYFYDELGSELFDRICDTPEYYQTRTELALLREASDHMVQRPGPTHLVELGSGAARKTRAILDAVQRSGQQCLYVPFDVSEEMLRSSAEQLLLDYPWLSIYGIVGDYDRHLHRIPPGDRHLIAFLGSTIGNFEHDDAVAFLANVREHMKAGDRLLLGTDLVKDPKVLNAAYNDAAGITEAFNKNVLSVINRELGGEFDLNDFEHVAHFDQEKSRIEMHLRAKRSHCVRIEKLGLSVSFEERETVLTEISRKFTRSSVEQMFREAGLELMSWYTPPNGYFALSVALRA